MILNILQVKELFPQSFKEVVGEPNDRFQGVLNIVQVALWRKLLHIDLGSMSLLHSLERLDILFYFKLQA